MKDHKNRFKYENGQFFDNVDGKELSSFEILDILNDEDDWTNHWQKKYYKELFEKQEIEVELQRLKNENYLLKNNEKALKEILEKDCS